jgi:predicted RNA-binding protein associated with RNAse of E/G family
MGKTIVLILIMLLSTSLFCEDSYIKMFELVEDIVNDPDNLEQAILDYGYINKDFWEKGYCKSLVEIDKFKRILKSFNSSYILRDFGIYSYPERGKKDEPVYFHISFSNCDSSYYIDISFFKDKLDSNWKIFDLGLSGEHAFPDDYHNYYEGF